PVCAESHAGWPGLQRLEPARSHCGMRPRACGTFIAKLALNQNAIAMNCLRSIAGILLATVSLACGQATTNSFVNWETPPVHPVALSPDHTRLAVCNLPDNRLEIFDLTSGRPVGLGSVCVELDPVSVRFRNDDEV